VTTIDLHPEEMLDAARRGTLGGEGEADLRAHLQRCAACRVSLTLPDDLRAQAAATGGDDALLARMVSGAMVGEPRADYKPHRAHGGAPLRRAAVALVLLLAGGSAGGAVWAARESIAKRFEPIIVQLRSRRAAEAPQREQPRARRVAAAAPAEAPVIVPVEEPIGPPAPPALVPAPPITPARAPRRIEVRAASPSQSAEALFADANSARRAGQYSLALRRYAELRHAHPGSREEITARVVVGDLMLAEGSAREALASFDSYLAANPDGTLGEEARVGRALSLMRLGRPDEERAAWTQLLRKHPDSVQGARARSRLAELR
jgi:TolA-binding protein